MALTSSLVTAPSGSAVAKYKISAVSSAVNTDTIVVNSKAKTEYANIDVAYKKIASDFADIATQFTKAAKKVTGATLQTRCKKAATKAKNQGTYCANRRKELESAFEFATLEARVQELEEALATDTKTSA